ncbi:glycerophosphodiester phosphodiesterase [Dysgonomonas sp. Marseille-P4677]|uniref:glycerophosphodiester phosphodiesterase family protein n=1 Tax=Dysgonomonas sp. Marseille-P4677 TaxID=2364790 RepID=UPI00191160AD|nr:glycerophosphodiester phosphodiesterase family protein [Dysgonomonas sp. Marseille-P4677]MBK5720531.1 glycerophosphodiester phosphodiesterase [Dysgonomonas sp. Marseille-P4677]
MIKQILQFGVFCMLMFFLLSCEDNETNKVREDAYDVHIDRLSPEMEKVRDYVPQFSVIAHRGSTFWTPEETEASYRWAREMGVDYLEADLQISKDGVILALHDDNLKRTTNIENVFGETLPKGRKNYYMKLGYTEAEAEAKVKQDKAGFVPNLTSYYTYEELLQLDAGTWFNETSIEQARSGFSTQKQYISTLEDLVQYSKGKKLKRDANGNRIYRIIGKTGGSVSTLGGTADVVKYEFEFEDDVEGGSGNVPGIYLEFKESWLNPSDFEKRVYDELDRLDMNIITKPENSNTPFYKDGKVNVGNTNGKVILQTFSLESLVRVADVYKGQVPMCFLLWKGNGATDIKDDSPVGYASFINLGVKYLAHIIGPCIAGAPNNYPELNAPWQDYLIKRAGMLNHPYSFDTRDQMAKYYGDYNFSNSGSNLFEPPYLDAMFTNRSEMTLDFFIDKGVRDQNAPQTVPDSEELLDKLGYTK